jgi:hypothetical protein
VIAALEGTGEFDCFGAEGDVGVGGKDTEGSKNGEDSYLYQPLSKSGVTS